MAGQLIPKRFFFCTVCGDVFFLTRQKENVGDILHGKVVPSRAA